MLEFAVELSIPTSMLVIGWVKVGNNKEIDSNKSS